MPIEAVRRPLSLQPALQPAATFWWIAFWRGGRVPAKAAEPVRTGKAKFGPLVVSGDGVSFKGRPPMPCSEINYAVSGGHLVIAPNAADFAYDEVKEIPLTDVPNYPVALRLMEQTGKPPAPPVRVYPKAMRQFVGRK